MARISECTYCGQTTTNAEWHPECRIAHLEDLIARIQEYLKSLSGTGRQLPNNLQEEIEKERVKTFVEFEKQRKNKRNREHKKELWEMARQNHLQKCAEEFEKKHPDPNPIMYG